MLNRGIARSQGISEMSQTAESPNRTPLRAVLRGATVRRKRKN